MAEEAALDLLRGGHQIAAQQESGDGGPGGVWRRQLRGDHVRGGLNILTQLRFCWISRVRAPCTEDLLAGFASVHLMSVIAQ